MKKTILLSLIVVLFSANLFAQEQDKKMKPQQVREKVMKKKKALYTERLNLTKEESDKFWVIYEEYDAKMFAIRDHQIEHLHRLKGKDILTCDAATAEAFIKTEMETERALQQTTASYVEKFQEVLPPQKVAKLLMEERKFMKELTKDCKQKHK